MRVILLNGPPRAGKDLAGKILRDHFSPIACLMKFADPVKLGTHALYQVPKEFMHVGAYEDCKEVSHLHFFGKTPREAYIEFSEKLVKPIKGKDFFGRVAARRVKEKSTYEYCIFTDSGFAEEAHAVVHTVGADNVLLIQLLRFGHDFTGDSRGYIQLPGVAMHIIVNDKDKDVLAERLCSAVRHWLGR